MPVARAQPFRRHARPICDPTRTSRHVPVCATLSGVYACDRGGAAPAVDHEQGWAPTTRHLVAMKSELRGTLEHQSGRRSVRAELRQVPRGRLSIGGAIEVRLFVDDVERAIGVAA